MLTSAQAPYSSTTFQSAPAIAGGRCPRSSRTAWCTTSFQSAPAIAGGRCIAHSSLPAELGMFQSAPAIAGGRCLQLSQEGRGVIRFNPRPPLLAGDAAGAQGRGGGVEVSIRARHCWRAMLRPPRAWCETCQFQSAPAVAGGRCCAVVRCRRDLSGFNPRPPLLAGDAQVTPKHLARWRVSIRARHCWRAMPRPTPRC